MGVSSGPDVKAGRVWSLTVCAKSRGTSGVTPPLRRRGSEEVRKVGGGYGCGFGEEFILL